MSIIQWIPVSEQMPESGKAVLAASNGQVLRAKWIARFTELEWSGEDCAECNDADGKYYWPEDWYEWNQKDEIQWALLGEDAPTHWMPLPAPPEKP